MPDKADPTELARMLRLLADRLEEDPEAVSRFLSTSLRKNHPVQEPEPIKKVKPDAPSGIDFDPVVFYHEQGKSEKALRDRLFRFTVKQLKEIAKKLSTKKPPIGRAKKQEWIDHIAHIATTSSERDVFMGI